MDTSIPSTFEYINNHGGFFNDDFRLFDTDNMSGELTYQLFLNGHPTFNDQQLNEINVTWGEKGIYDYKRALLRSSVPLDGATTSLDSLETVRASLANNHNIDFENIEYASLAIKKMISQIKMTSKYNAIVNLFQRGMLSMMVNGMYIRMGGLNK